VHQWGWSNESFVRRPLMFDVSAQASKVGYGFSVGRLRNFRIVRAAVANKDENINKQQSGERAMVASADSVNFSIGALREDHSNVGVGNDQKV